MRNRVLVLAFIGAIVLGGCASPRVTSAPSAASRPENAVETLASQPAAPSASAEEAGGASAAEIANPAPAATIEEAEKQPAVAAAKAEPTPAGHTLVEVNGEPITAEEFSLGYPAYRQALGFPPDTPELRQQCLDTLVTSRLLEQEARRQGLESDPEYYARLAEAKRRVIENELLGRDGQTDPTDAEIEAYYTAHQGEFTQPATIQVRNITTDTREAAERARQRILDGEPFQRVAAAVSIHPSRGEGGALPPISRGAYSKAFEDVAFALKTGELSPVFHTDMGYHVIEKTGETPAKPLPLEQVKDLIRSQLAEQKRAQALGRLEESLRQQAEVRVLKNP
ncbi:MAG: peptidyl-prolyl cis-trans isomerase [Candidatus Sumerlaeota bacterium]|nr:peptidyl-prolyl cis-trans isomerase [Candidatus Sumerlaeota bacterium]